MKDYSSRIKRIKKYMEYGYTKVILHFKQKVYNYKGVKLKYILEEEKNSNDLIIVFSACTRQGIKARYNYMRTLSQIKANKLFILDDFAKDHRGSYYLGYDFNFLEEKATHSLINRIIHQTKARKLLFCGSSKGGWAALNIGNAYENAVMIVGAPQYYLGRYLSGITWKNETLVHICGEVTQEKLDYLDSYLPDKLQKNKWKETQKIYLHYSINDLTYRHDVQFLIADLKRLNYQLYEDVKQYKEHGDVSIYFPDFLINTIHKVML